MKLLIPSLLSLFLIACGDGSSTSANNLNDAEILFKSSSSSKIMPSSIFAKSSSSVVVKSGSSSAKLSSNSAAKSSSSVVLSSETSFGKDSVEGYLTDSRDGQTYKTVTIGTQTWMVQNLNYETANSYCYEDNETNCTKYGRLYTWAAAMDSVGVWNKNAKGCGYSKTCSPTYPVRGVCPDGWHLPNKTEWEALLSVVGDPSTAGSKLKSTSGWYSNGNGTDSFSFLALPAGHRTFSSGIYNGKDVYADFWSSTMQYGLNAYFMSLSYNSDRALLDADIYNKGYAFSVRCLKDDVSEQTAKSSSGQKTVSSSSVYVVDSIKVTLGSMTDSRDDQIYKTVTIGSQTWMAENLNYETANSYCPKDNETYCTKYGRLYTLGAAMDCAGVWSKNGLGCGCDGYKCSPTYPVRGVCPDGWHLPTQTEWNTLLTAVGGQSIAGVKLKSMSGWNNGGNGTDEFSFSVLPAGAWHYESYAIDKSYNEGEAANFWSSTVDDYDNAYEVYLFYGFDNAALRGYHSDYGFSVRCLKDNESEQTAKSSSSVKMTSSSTVVILGLTGNLTDSRDDQTYKTVTIGSQIWMAENLNYETSNSYCYKDNSAMCSKYGRLYTWAAAMDSAGLWSNNGKGCGYNKTCSPTYPVREVCPEGWHLPTKMEWNTLFTAVGGFLADASVNAGFMLKSTSDWHEGNGKDAFSFSALPAGWGDDYDYHDKGYKAYFWSSTMRSYYALSMNLNNSESNAYLDFHGTGYRYSVRCLKD